MTKRATGMVRAGFACGWVGVPGPPFNDIGFQSNRLSHKGCRRAFDPKHKGYLREG
jgi:hypothetical protein